MDIHVTHNVLSLLLVSLYSYEWNLHHENLMIFLPPNYYISMLFNANKWIIREPYSAVSHHSFILWQCIGYLIDNLSSTVPQRICVELQYAQVNKLQEEWKLFYLELAHEANNWRLAQWSEPLSDLWPLASFPMGGHDGRGTGIFLNFAMLVTKHERCQVPWVTQQP